MGALLASHVLNANEISVPDHFHLECASALRRMELRNDPSGVEAKAALDNLRTLHSRRVDTSPLLDEAWEMRRNVTMADGLYVVPARILDVPLVTGDTGLVRAPELGIATLTSSSPPSR